MLTGTWHRLFAKVVAQVKANKLAVVHALKINIDILVLNHRGGNFGGKNVIYIDAKQKFVLEKALAEPG